MYRWLVLLYFLASFFLKADENASVLTADFFAGALADATAISEESGKQRLIDVKSTTLSPALAFGSSLNTLIIPKKTLFFQEKEMVLLWM